ncbi:MAG: HAMP domain-containing sensor histidine kinase [Nocardioides sp.]
MNRLVIRLVISHALVAVLGAAATFVVVRLLAPTLFDRSMGRQMGLGSPLSASQRGVSLREQFIAAVDQALVVGVLVGGLAAAAFGTLAAYRLTRPLASIRTATRELAAGRYSTEMPLPRERELAELATDINRLGHSLEQTESHRVRLLGEVAHEMRTPLTVIDGTLEAMIDEVVAVTPEELGRVSEEVRRLRRLSDDLSALSRSAEGRLDLRREEVELREVVSVAAERLRPQVEDAGLTLEVDQGDLPVPCQVDADRIGQVVTNLVGNALAATPTGGTVTVGVARDQDRAFVTVTDTGVGLPPEELDRVFERFHRAPGRTRASAGTGVGLTIARALVRAHDGDLTASSPGLEQGATFTAWLPLTQASRLPHTWPAGAR